MFSFRNCTSSNCVYIIECELCKKFYIGETGREINKRIEEHLKNIIQFNQNLDQSLINLNTKSETAIHFNYSGHEKFQILHI